MDPVLELRTAMVERMRAFADLAALVGGRIYDEVPQAHGRGTSSVRPPYVSMGPSSYDPELIDCVEGGEIMIQVDAWSDRPGQVEVSKVAHEVRRAFRGFEPTLSDNALVEFNHWRTDYLIDGAIKHASIRFIAIVEEPST